MGWLRKTTSAVLLLGVAPTGLSPAAPTVELAPSGLLVAVGDAQVDHAWLWVRNEDGGPVRLRYRAEDAPGDTASVDVLPSEARDLTAAVKLSRLSPATRYRYEVDDGIQVVRGHFATAPRPHTDAPAHLVWSGDLGGAGHCRDVEDGYRIFRAMTRRQPDLFLFVGDTIYADHVCGTAPHVPGADFIAWTLGDFHRKHRYNRADPALQEFFRSTAVYATWDDHEVRNNFAATHERLAEVGKQAFLDYWPVAPSPEEPGRLYRSVRWGRHVEVFMLDTRQYRSSNWQPDGPGKTMLGDRQRRWLLDGIAASDATWKVVVSTVPFGLFTGGAASDSWSSANVFGYPRRSGTGFVHERDAILGALRARGVRNVVILSGDVHHADLIRHQPWPDFAIYEFIAGPLAARQGYPRFLDRSLGSRSLGSLGFAANFGELVADADGLQARIIDASGTTRVSVRLRPTEGP